MSIDWTWLIVGLALGVLFGAMIKSTLGGLKAKATGG